jgi:hypothetical protein
MKSLEEATRIKERIESDYLCRPGVTGIDVGLGHQNEPIIRIYVSDREEAAKQGAFPSDVEGVPVIIIERRFHLH